MGRGAGVRKRRLTRRIGGGGSTKIFITDRFAGDWTTTGRVAHRRTAGKEREGRKGKGREGERGGCDGALK